MAEEQDLHRLEQDMLAELSGSRLMDYTRMASQGIRLSGRSPSSALQDAPNGWWFRGVCRVLQSRFY